MRYLLCPALVTATAFAAPALADAITYKGKVGTLPVILELVPSEASDEEAFGRYAYLAKGTDIPLHGGKAQDGSVHLEEEAPCTERTCQVDEDLSVAKPPIGADWTLTMDGTGLSGTWKDRATGKTLPVRLERRGERPVEVDSNSPFDALRPDFVLAETSKAAAIQPDALPYDFLKLDWPRKAGAETKVGGVVLRIETDARNGVEYPVVVTLGGEDTKPINAFLQQRRLQAELPSFSCRSQAYAGFGWADYHMETTADDDSNVPSFTLEHASPRLLGFAEGGSFFCGGAYPENFLHHVLADAVTGAWIEPESLLVGFNPTGREGDRVDPKTYDNSDGSLSFVPSADLAAYVNARRDRFDASQEADCGLEDLVRTNLGVYFTQDELVFTLRDLPHVIAACADDLLTVPLRDARPLLRAEAARYFAVLDR